MFFNQADQQPASLSHITKLVHRGELNCIANERLIDLLSVRVADQEVAHQRQYLIVVVVSQMRVIGLLRSHALLGCTLHRGRPYQRVGFRPFPRSAFLDH